MSLTGFLAYAAALALAAAIPGPGVVALIARALGAGFRSAAFMGIGLIIGDLIYLATVLMGLAILAQSFGTAFLVIKWAGVAYLCWLAFKLWTHGIQAESVTAERSADGPWASLLAGLLVTLGNPKVMVFYIAITPTIINIAAVDAVDFGVLMMITAMVLMVVLTPYLALAARARGLLASPRALTILNRLAGTALAGAAAAIAVRS